MQLPLFISTQQKNRIYLVIVNIKIDLSIL